MHYIWFLLLLVSMSIFQGCEYKSDISVPGYLEINKITLEHENAIGITDAWVYVDGNIQGVYELPAKFPVISEGESEIRVYPGIKVNGISATRTNYPFYRPYIVNMELESGKTHAISPISGYESWANVIIVDDFERSEPKFILGDISDTIMLRSTDSFQGLYAGAVYLDTLHKSFSARTELNFEIPDFNGNYSGMFLELNFKSDVYLEVGVFVTESISILYLQPTTEWKKIYIDLYNSLLKSNAGDKFIVYLYSTLGNDLEEATILLDDIKIVYAKPLK